MTHCGTTIRVIVKGAMIIWEWYDTEENEYHVVLEVSFDR